jgi:hypothetical protein
MKIAQSAVIMLSGHQLYEEHSITEKLEAWVGPPPGAQAIQPEDKVSLSKGLCNDLSASVDKAKENYGLDKIDERADPRFLMTSLLIEYFTGRKIKLMNPEDLSQKSDIAENIGSKNQDAVNTQQMEGWGISYDFQEMRAESEQTIVTIQGIVKTSDEKEVVFNLDLQMSRNYVEQTAVNIRLGDEKKIDPIVINFGGTAVQLTDWKFDFDLSADEIKEEIPFVTGGSGILVFDKNGDRQVNDGSELFGPITGNGFTELAVLDEDKNNWIDENDATYKQLYVWQKDEASNEAMIPLSQMNVGALFVGAISSPFDLRDQNNNIKGQIIRTGVYLSNSGAAGSLQQIDVAV